MPNNNSSIDTNSSNNNNNTNHVDDEEQTRDEIMVMHNKDHTNTTGDDDCNNNEYHSSSSSIFSYTKSIHSDGHDNNNTTTATTRTKRNRSTTTTDRTSTHPADLEHHHNINKSGRKGDPRMHKAVAARIANPKLSLYEALVIGGFVYPGLDGGGTDGGTTASTMDDNLQVDCENVTLAQRKNQLSRRIRLAKQQQQQVQQMQQQHRKQKQQQQQHAQEQDQQQQVQQKQHEKQQQEQQQYKRTTGSTTETVAQQKEEEISSNNEIVDEKVPTTTTTNEASKNTEEEYRSTNASAAPTTTTTTTTTITTNHNFYEFDNETTNTIAQKLLRNIKTELNEEDFLSSEDEYYGDNDYIAGNDNITTNTAPNVTSFGGKIGGDVSTGSKAIRKHYNNSHMSFPYYGTNEPNRIRAKDHPEYHPIIVIPPVRVSQTPPTLYRQLHTQQQQQQQQQQPQSSHIPSKTFRKNPEFQRSVSSASSHGGKTFAKLAQVIGPNAFPTSNNNNNDSVTGEESSHLQQTDEDYFFPPGGGKLVTGKSTGKSINNHGFNDPNTTTTTIPSQTTASNNNINSKIRSKLAAIQHDDDDDERFRVPPGGGKLVTGKLINLPSTETAPNSKFHGKKFVPERYITTTTEDDSMNSNLNIDPMTDPNYLIANDHVHLHEYNESIQLLPEPIPQAPTIGTAVVAVSATNAKGVGVNKSSASDQETSSQNTTSTMDAITSLTQIAAKAGLTLEQFVESLQNGDTAAQIIQSSNNNTNNNDTTTDSPCTTYSTSNKACKERLHMAVALYQSENRALYERCMLLAGYPQSTVGQYDTTSASFHTLSPEYIEFIINCWSSEGQRLHALLKEQQQQQIVTVAPTGKIANSKILQQQQQQEQSRQKNQIQLYQDQMQNILQQVRTQVQSQFPQEN